MGFAVLFAHMSGFAVIGLLVKAQQLPFCRMSPVHSFLVVVPGLLFLVTIVGVGRYMRTIFWMRKKHLSVSVAHLAEALAEEKEDPVEEEAQEAENDMIGLGLAMATIQAIRFLVEGEAPKSAELI